MPQPPTPHAPPPPPGASADVVAGLSLGTIRTLRFRTKAGKTAVYDHTLLDRELYVMRGSGFQTNFTHEVPPGKEEGQRVSFTFRCHTKS